MKKILFISIFLILIIPKNTQASSLTLIKVGNNYFDNLQDAINASNSGDIINLITDINLEETININKTVNINLNGKTISAKEKVFLIEGGSLNLSGTGLIKETSPNYGAIMIKGSTYKNNTNYSTLKVSSGITLEGWSGIFISHTDGKSYGVSVNTEATIISKTDAYGTTGSGIYLNGTIQDNQNAPIINIKRKSIINSSGVGLYLAGYAVTNIDGANITGEESAISIKAGTLNIKDGTFTCIGPDNTPTTSNNNGINPSGAALQIESNDNYKGNIGINISGGTFISRYSHAVYEYLANTSKTNVKEFDILGGTYKSKKDIFLLSNSFLNEHTKFITGGTYSKNIENYLDNDYTISEIDNMYVVIKSTMKEELIKKSKNKSIIKLIIHITIPILIASAVYLNKTKILKVIKFSKHIDNQKKII